MRIRIFWPVALCMLTAGCSSRQPAQQVPPGTDGSAIVLRGSEMSGMLLDGLRSRVPGMTVSTVAGGCPLIIFRGPRSVRYQDNPSVYVDGTLMLDTCILTQIRAHDVDTVEVYSSGITARPGVQRNPFGVIVVTRVRE